MLQTAQQLGSLVVLLSTDQKFPGFIPGSAVDFPLIENYSMVCTDWEFLCFSDRTQENFEF